MGPRQEEEESATLVTAEQPKSSCTTYMAEGDKLYKLGEFKKAIESYSTALERADAEGVDKRQSFYSRALCQLHLGNSEAALADAEESLEDDQTYSKGLWVKAEALYEMGDFEYALMFFHRGYHSRSDNADFKIGIQKSQEAIMNAIGGRPSAVQLTTDCDLTYFYSHEMEKKKEKKLKPKPKSGAGRMATSKPVKKEEKKRDEQRQQGTKSSRKTSRRLLGELYSDKEYLEQLYKDGLLTGQPSNSGKRIKEYTGDAITYLEKREEFWRQQDPSRTHDKTYERASSGKKSALDKRKNPGKFIMKQIDKIEADLEQSDYAQAEKRCKSVLNEALVYSDEELPNKQEFLATIYALNGSALMEQEKFSEAEEQFLNDFDISESNKSYDGKNRALENLGRVCMKQEKFEEAISYWKQKLALIQVVEGRGEEGRDKDQETEENNLVEKIWLYHEIGKCYLEMGEFEQSKNNGQKALETSKECDDDLWQMNGTILVAKSEVKMGDFETAGTSFGEALELARKLKNKDAEESIEKAIRDVNRKLSRNVVRNAAEKSEEKEGEQSSNPVEQQNENNEIRAENEYSEDEDPTTATKSDEKCGDEGNPEDVGQETYRNEELEENGSGVKESID